MKFEVIIKDDGIDRGIFFDEFIDIFRQDRKNKGR